MSRARLFIENFFIYGLGNVLTKAVPFLMLPVLTRMIKDPAVFGIFDIYTIIIRFGIPITVLGSYDAMFRLYFDGEDQAFRRQICSSSLAIVATTGSLVLIAALSLWLYGYSPWQGGYRWLIFCAGLVIFSQAIRNVVAAPTRMENKRRTIIILSLLGPILYYGIAMGLALRDYPLQGLVAGNLISGIVVLILYGWLNRSYFTLKGVNKGHIKELLKIGIPLTPTFLIYWIFTSCDRFMIGHYLGMDAVGLYGVGARLSAISQGIYMAFAGGWQYFAFSTMKDSDHTELMSRVFEVLGALSIISLLVLLPFVDWIFSFMVAEGYRGASVVFPYLYISPLVLMLFQTIGSQFLVVKKSYLSMCTLALGAVVNVLLNWYLIPKIGIEGAAIATALGYVVSMIVAFIMLKRLSLIQGNLRFLVPVMLCLLSIVNGRAIWISPVLFSSGSMLLIGIVYREQLRMIWARFGPNRKGERN